jgi:ubiquinone/menaquinone biosynthesis C-methylase UbiE
MTADHQGQLGAVYDAKSIDDIKALYDTWATTYDGQMAQFGYRHPTICLALLARHVPAGSAPLLDAGAGTGLFGEWAAIAGYPHIEALDISEGMLAVAAKKNCYKKLHKLALGGDLPFADNEFAAIVSSGVFTTGHVGPEGLHELIRICRKGGKIILTVKTTLWEESFAEAIEAFENEGLVAVVEQTAPYVSMPGEQGTIPSFALVLDVRK